MKCVRYALRFTCILVAFSSVLVMSGCPNSDDNTGPVLTTDVADTTSAIDVEVPPPALTCVSSNDCLALDGTGLCTIAICDPIVGQCRLHDLPNCCERDEDCDDDDPVTDDTCNTELSVCQWTYSNTPCQVDLDCDTGESCIYFECDSVCSYWKKPNCCTSAKDCDDGDLCTVEECENFSCISAPSESPICCGEVLESYPFNTGIAPSLDVQTNGEAVRWQASQSRYRSPPGSAYFGDGTTNTYENPVQPDGSQAASKGTLLTAPIAFPDAGATLRFSVWVDVETELDWDLFEVVLIPSVGSDQAIWSKSELDPQADYRTWIDVEVDLASYAGTTARLGFLIDTVDATVNTGEGVYLDDIAVFSPCVTPPILCADDADCDDSNVCTVGSCDSGGTCTFQPVESCCETVEDCPATTSVCETALCIENSCAIEVKESCCGPETQCPELECRVSACDLSNNACVYQDIPDCCVAGTGAVLCDDEDPCTQDTCEENQCVNNPVSGCVPCDTDSECNDQDSCTTDTCSQSKCSNVLVPDCLACDTASDCPVSDDVCDISVCAEGVCTVETAPTCTPCFSSAGCDDDDPCTTDSCVDGTCQFAAIPGCIVQCTSGSDCDDANTCTIDACNQGQCINGPIPGCCTDDGDCNDNDVCTSDSCVNSVCTFQALPNCSGCQTNTDCFDGDECTIDICDVGTGECSYLANPAPACSPECIVDTDCGGGDACTTTTCQQGQCINTPIVGCCTADSQCDDFDPCTSDTCQSGTNVCQNVPNGSCPACQADADCDDGVACTIDSCDVVSGQCNSAPSPGCCIADADCTSSNPCMLGTCGADNTCAMVPIPGCCIANVECEDGLQCTYNQCINNQCADPVQLPNCCIANVECEDGDPCTYNQCINNQCAPPAPLPGCCIANVECDDGNPCTYNQCVDNQCAPPEPLPNCCIANVECEDGDLCTYNQCINNQCAAPVPLPNCCTSSILVSQNFDAAPPLGWEYAQVGSVGWQVSNGQAQSLPNALWFGNPATGDYSEPSDLPPSGTATSISFGIPAGQFAVLSFSIWAGIEQNPDFDVLEVRVLTGAGTEVVVWDKTALPEYESWQAVQVNLSAFEGQDIRLQWSFDALDSVDNGGQGIYVDDLLIQTVCNPIDICNFNGECDDGNGCTADVCTDGTCVNSPIPDCCTATSDCDDGFACTTDSCINNQCQFDLNDGCCQFDAECDDGNACTMDLCIGNQCATQPMPGGNGCCSLASDCADADPCTVDSCVQNVCVYSASPDPSCCSEGTLLTADFDDATSQDFAFINDGSAAQWSVQSKRSTSAPFSLYFGIPGVWTYVTDPASSGTAISPEFLVPVTSGAVSLKFNTWADIDAEGFFFDTYNVKVLSGSTLQTVWNFSDDPTSAQWTAATIDLSDYKGQSIRLYWSFQSQVASFGDPGEGVYVDDVSVVSTCAP